MTTGWTGKTVMITGAEGFIGSHLSETLVRAGAKVRAFIHYSPFHRWGWLDSLDKDVLDEIDVFPGDIRDAYRVRAGVTGQDYVFHLSSLIGIPYSYQAPDSYVQVNIGGAMNVLNAVRDSGATRLIHTSTSEVYGSAKYVPINEEHPLQPQSPYSASKMSADMMALSYHVAFELPVAVARPFNTYGPRQSARAVIPVIMSQLHAGAKELKLGALTPTRDFNYVLDTVAGFMAIAQCDRAIGEVVNLGSGRETSISDLVHMIIAATGKQATVVTDPDRLRPQESEVDRLLADSSRAKEWAGWEPAYTLEQGLEATSDWVRDNLAVFKTDVYAV